MTPDEKKIEEYMGLVWGGRSEDQGVIHLWSAVYDPKEGRLKDSGKSCDWADDLTKAAQISLRRSREGREVYCGMGLRAKALPSGQRGGADDVSAVCGLWVEVDYGDAGHKNAKSYPPDQAAALGLVERMGLKPTIVIDSGHGIYAHWLWKEPWVFGSPEERKKFSALAQRWQKRAQRLAQLFGWSVDSTFDLARVLRVGGTVNRKVPDEPKAVRVLIADGPRYVEWSDFEDTLKDEPEGEEQSTRTKEQEEQRFARLKDLKFPSTQLPDLNRIEGVRAVDSTFDKTWTYKRDFKPDNSPSIYCMSIASVLKGAGWSDQDIVDAMIFFRQMHRANPKPPSWYVRTLEKAEQSREEKAAGKNGKKKSESQQKVEEALKTVESANGDRPKSLEGLTRIFLAGHGEPSKFKILGFIQRFREDAQYALRVECDNDEGGVETRELDIGSASALLGQAAVRNVILNEVDITLPKMKDETWAKVVRALKKVKELHSPKLGRKEGETVEWIEQHVLSKQLFGDFMDTADWKTLALSTRSPFVEKGSLWVSSECMLTQLQRHGDRLSRQSLQSRLKGLGFKDEIHSSPRRTYWGLSIEDLRNKSEHLCQVLTSNYSS
jgi:hypothetical protein